MTLRIGLQLYSVRTSLAESTAKTLQRISELGYRYLEAANHAAATDDGIGFGVSARELGAMFTDLDLQIVGAHVSPLQLDRLPAILDYQLEIGCRQIGNDIEFYPRGDRDYLLKRIAFFNRVGQLCADRGMRFYYHNHYQEFQSIDGETIYQTILENTDPELVFVEMDTYWVTRAGHDPIAWMRRYPDRIVLLHQKDFPVDAPQPINMYDGIVDPDAAIDMALFESVEDTRCFTEIGTGVLPIQDIIDTALTLPNLEYMLLEQDYTRFTDLESIERSRSAFDAYHGISWT